LYLKLCFFLVFFGLFFHSSLSPAIEIGAIWPPKDILVIGPWGVPLLNTIVLLSSGVSVTWAHHAIIENNRKQALIAMYITLIFAQVFTCLQGFEYVESQFTISDGIYGSTFYMTTGFHGFHVFVGTYLLLISTIRLIKYHFTSRNHFGFEAAAWYWHFVDVVWLFLFVVIYWWGGL